MDYEIKWYFFDKEKNQCPFFEGYYKLITTSTCSLKNNHKEILRAIKPFKRFLKDMEYYINHNGEKGGENAINQYSTQNKIIWG